MVDSSEATVPIRENDDGRHGVETVLEWQPRGPCLGVIDQDLKAVWLHRDVAVAVANELAQKGRDPLPLTADQLVEKLHEKGLLAATELHNKKQTYRVRFHDLRHRCA